MYTPSQFQSNVDLAEEQRVNALISPYIENDENIIWVGGKDADRSRSASEKMAIFFKILKLLGAIFMCLLIALFFVNRIAVIIVLVLLGGDVFIEWLKIERNAKSGLYVITDKSVIRVAKSDTTRVTFDHIAEITTEKLGKAGRLNILYADKNVVGDMVGKEPYKVLVFDSIDDYENVKDIITKAAEYFKKSERFKGR